MNSNLSSLEKVLKIYEGFKDSKPEYLGLLAILCEREYVEKTGKNLHSDEGYKSLFNEILKEYDSQKIEEMFYNFLKNFDKESLGEREKRRKGEKLETKTEVTESIDINKILKETTLTSRLLIYAFSAIDWRDIIEIEKNKLGKPENSLRSNYNYSIKKGYIEMIKEDNRIKKFKITNEGKKQLEKIPINEDFLTLISDYDPLIKDKYYQFLNKNQDIQVEYGEDKLILRKNNEEKKLILDGLLTNAGKRFREILCSILDGQPKEELGELVEYNLIRRGGNNWYVTDEGKKIYEKLILPTRIKKKV